MKTLKIWHNPNCSKSREAKSILENSNQKFEVFEYLKKDFDAAALKEIIKLLGISDVRAMLRTKEEEYTQLNIDNSDLTQDQIINLVVLNPKLVERPIVIKEDKAVIGRPMNNVVELLD
ncbi:MAG: arsenate reductase (glutaredoxin) [Campylobacterota bacterium]|nr:arsenate reductase (glutaredoxin) [Campylobacterota bacterium]